MVHVTAKYRETIKLTNHDMCEGSKNPVSWWLWMGGSIALALAAAATAISWNVIFDALIASLLVLSPSSQTYQRWVAPDQPLFFEVYMFNWTNANHFPSEKPKLEQLGPYRFREVRKHVNVTFHPHNSSVAYRTQRSWFFDETTSNGSLHDNVTSVNMIAAGAMFKVRDEDLFTFKFGLITAATVRLAFLKYQTKLSVTKTVGEMLFEGYEDDLLTMFNLLVHSKDVPKMDRMGWFYTRNNSIETDGYMEISTGAGDSSLGRILKWNHQDSLQYFKENCSRLAGSAGEFVPRNLTENSTLTMFVPDLCRTVNLEHVDSGVMNGLDYHKFEMLERCFDKSSVSDENTCFCNGDCMWSGVMNVSACRYNSPAFLSLPHFLHGDPRLRDAVAGMAPDPKKHSFYFSVEPTLGVPLDVAARFQFNVYLPKWEYLIGPVSSVPEEMLFPIFWVQQHVIVTDNIFKELRVVVAVSRWGGLILALIGLISASVAVICSSRKPKYIIVSTGL